MKKILLIFMLLFTMSFTSTISADTYIYKTTGFAYKQLNDYGVWTNWTPWQNSDMVMTIDFDNSIVKIYSPQPQVYIITKYVREYTDSDGGKQIEMKFVDQDEDYGTMRLRIEQNGNSQIYIDFANIMWVYNVKRIK